MLINLCETNIASDVTHRSYSGDECTESFTIDAIYFSNKITRNALIMTFVVTALVYPLNLRYTWPILITVFYLVPSTVNTAWVYKRLR